MGLNIIDIKSLILLHIFMLQTAVLYTQYLLQCHEMPGQSGQTAVLAPLHQEQLILSPFYLCCVFRCVTPPPRHVAAISQLMQPSAQYRHSAACTSWPPRPPWPPWHPGPGQDQPGTSRGLQLQILQFIFLSPASTASTIECFYFDIKRSHQAH